MTSARDIIPPAADEGSDQSELRTIVRDVMTSDVEVLGPDSTVADAARRMADEDVGALPVCEPDGELVGVVTDRDIVVRVIAAGIDPATNPIRSALSDEWLVTVDVDDALETAVAKMKRAKVRRLPVLDHDDRLVGMVSQGDIATNAPDWQAGDLLEDISAAP